MPALEQDDSYPVTVGFEDLLQMVQPAEFADFQQNRIRKLRKCIRKIGQELESMVSCRVVCSGVECEPPQMLFRFRP